MAHIRHTRRRLKGAAAAPLTRLYILMFPLTAGMLPAYTLHKRFAEGAATCAARRQREAAAFPAHCVWHKPGCAEEAKEWPNGGNASPGR
jgi:hypothetical protein